MPSTERPLQITIPTILKIPSSSGTSRNPESIPHQVLHPRNPMKKPLNRPLRPLLCLPLALRLASCSLVSCVSLSAANVAPNVAVISAAMRPGTTLMDITYKVTDPDDPTVMVRALAFVDGTRSFSNVIRPVTWVEGTQANLGDAITTGVNHTLTWDVKADWSIDLGNIKVEILARDGRGLLPLEWITIPAAGGNPAVTISKNVPTDAQVLDALFWMYADNDAELVLTNGNLKGTATSGLYSEEILASGNSLLSMTPAVVYLYKRMNVARASGYEKLIGINARSGITSQFALHAASRNWDGDSFGVDTSALSTNSVNLRWVRNNYTNGDFTMADRFTGLMWVGPPTVGGTMNQAAATSYCPNLSYAQYDDWYLPNQTNLSMLLTERQYFPGYGWRYWASGTQGEMVGENSGAWIVSRASASANHNVLPVRVY